MKKKWFLLPMALIMLAGCDYSHKEEQHGLFYTIFVKPMDALLHVLGHAFNENYGLAIIVIVFILRLILMPLMCIQVKNIHVIRGKTEVVKPEINKIQEKIKEAQSPEERRAANKLLMKKYNEYGINPFKNLIGTFPILIQIPILLGLYTSIKYPTSGGITQHPHFLWFNLVKPDIWITAIAGVLYFIQSYISTKTMPDEQRQMAYMMMIVSPIMIIWISYQSAAALGLYWSVSAAFLIVQTYFANMYYSKRAKEEVAPMIKQYEKEKNQGTKKGKNTQVVSKNNKKKK